MVSIGLLSFSFFLSWYTVTYLEQSNTDVMDTINISNTKDEVATIIKREIISGNIAAGDCITQNEVADQLGLSRMPIREAFNVLVQDGFLKKLPNRKIMVNAITPYTIESYGRVLSAIECEFLHRIASADGTAVSQLMNIPAGSELSFNSAEDILNWHVRLSSICHDEILAKIHSNIMGSFFSYALQHFPVDFSSHNAMFAKLQTLLIPTEYNLEEMRHQLEVINFSILAPLIKNFSNES